MRPILREPLLHFLLLGGLIFAAYAFVAAPDAGPAHEIVVSDGKIRSMTALFERTWQRAPSPAELQGLIDEYVREEVFYREGLALGLDRDDVVVRRRVGQKMQFVSDELAAPPTPTDAELEAFLAQHGAAFATEPRFTFQQIYLDPRRRGAELADDVERLRRQLRQDGGDIAGDPTMLPATLSDAPAREVRATFGEEFASALAIAPTGEWHGPVSSSYGVHLVMLSRRTATKQPSLDEVREAVTREWTRERQQQAAAQLYRRLLQQYTITVDSSGGDDEAGATSASLR